MSETTNWEGTVSGTGTFTATVDIVRENTRIEGELRLVQAGIGQLQAKLVGEWRSDNKVSAKLEGFRGDFRSPVILPKTGAIEGTFDQSRAVIRGQWNTDAGTAGEFMWTQVAVSGKKASAAPPAGELLSLYSGRIAGAAKKLGAPLIAWHKRHPDWPVLLLGVALTAGVGIFLLDFIMGLSH